MIGIPKNLDVASAPGCLILQRDKNIPMDSKIAISKSICNDEVVDYIASRYSITPQQVITHFMCQEGILMDCQGDGNQAISFEENEMAILRDMGLRPSHVEFEETTI